MRVFISNLSSSLGRALRVQFQDNGHEVVGSVNEEGLIGHSEAMILKPADGSIANSN